VRAHLEGLALGAREAPGMLEARLRSGDADETFAAAAALLVTSGWGSHEQLLDALRETTPPGGTGIVEALCHLPLAEGLELGLRTIVATSGDARLAPALEVLSFHRLLPSVAIEPAADVEDAETRRAAARAIGRVGGPAAWIAALGEDTEPDVRDAALNAGIRCGERWVLERLRSVCRDSRGVTPEAIWLLACLGDRSDVETLCVLARRPELGESALAGLATLGCVECVEPLLEFMGDARPGRAAGRAFRRITGLEPVAHAAIPDSPKSEDATFEDLRPIPDARATRVRWHEHADDFKSGVRWRLGRPLTPAAWRAAPHHGDLLTRREELTRLWAREPERFRTLELDAPAARQRAVAA
jgi:uncharacterized protein (TIGR02270 family)